MKTALTCTTWCLLLTAAYADPPHFREHLIGGGYSYSFGIATADIDGDGDLDLTSADALPNNSLYWYENKGNAKFQKHFVQRNDPERLERHSIADIDQDGHPDIVIVKNLFGDILWFRNPGTPTDGQLWKRNVICDKGLVGAYDVAVGDFDGDGDPDVAASSWRLSNNYVWFENDGTPDGGPWKMRIIDEGVAETRNIRAGDIDGDGDLDLACTARVANLVVWYENTGKPARDGWRKDVIDDRSPHPLHGELSDIDRDGDLDFVLCLGMGYSGQGKLEQVAWYENNGSPARNRWKKHLIADMLWGAFEAATLDYDKDGDLDVVLTTGYADLVTNKSDKFHRIWIMENTGNPQTGWRPHLLREQWRRVNQVITADIDGDGEIDVIAGAERGSNEVRWWRNLRGH